MLLVRFRSESRRMARRVSFPNTTCPFKSTSGKALLGFAIVVPVSRRVKGGGRRKREEQEGKS
jgi:hypothetical protein